MKHNYIMKIFLISPVIIAVLFLTAGGINYRIDKQRLTPRADALEASPETKAIGKIFERKCLDCHSSRGQTPFYASFPLIKRLISKDIQEGLEEFNFDTEFFNKQDGDYAFKTLHHLEEVIEENEMPPAAYRWLHWTTRVSENERALILNWLSRQQQ